MNEQMVVEKLVAKVREYAAGRAKDVARGAETPRLAATLLQKYGRGVVDAAAVIFDAFDAPNASAPVWKIVEEETDAIDPKWREHQRARWAARPADLSTGEEPLF